jgi:osmoprotectant transport system ATP-binding protein
VVGAIHPAVRLEHVSKRFDGTSAPAVEDLDLEVAQGSVVVLIGPSGCGKTTTLRMINRLIEPSSGRILLNGRDSTQVDPIALRLGIGYVIQAVGLFPHRTVAANIATVPRALGWERPRIRRRIAELAELVGLGAELLDRYPDELSGGQQQRVGVARALAADPPLLLMDEPFGAVDPVVRTRLQVELLELQARLHKTIVLVTHDLDEAVALADRIALFDVGGRLAQFATPDELLHRPAEAFVEEFLGAERNLRRLAIRRVAELELDPIVGDGDAAPEQGAVVGRGSTLRAAMEILLTARSATAHVEEDGRIVGSVSLGSIRRALAEDPR